MKPCWYCKAIRTWDCTEGGGEFCRRDTSPNAKVYWAAFIVLALATAAFAWFE